MRSALRIAAGIGVAAVGIIAVTPAMAAAPISQAGANAITVSIAGNEQGSGNVTAKNDGSAETKTGDTEPTVGVLGGEQNLIRSGVLAQEATATAKNGTGRSAACAGAAGAGGSVVRIGDTECLKSDQGTARLSIASLDLSNSFLINPNSALGEVDTAPISTVVGEVTSALAGGVSDASEDLANLGLSVNLDAISAHCNAGPGTAGGDSDFSDTNVALNVPGQEPVVVQRLKAHYPPNTDVFVDIADAADVILAMIEDDLRTSLQGAFAPLADEVVSPVREALINEVLSQVQGQLQPLSDNLLRLTLNKQSRPSPDAIRVSALDLAVVPAAEEQVGGPLAGVQIGNVVCGPAPGRRGSAGRRARGPCPGASPPASRPLQARRPRTTDPSTGSHSAPSRSCWRAVRRCWSFAGSAADRRTGERDEWL